MFVFYSFYFLFRVSIFCHLLSEYIIYTYKFICLYIIYIFRFICLFSLTFSFLEIFLSEIWFSPVSVSLLDIYNALFISEQTGILFFFPWLPIIFHFILLSIDLFSKSLIESIFSLISLRMMNCLWFNVFVFWDKTSRKKACYLSSKNLDFFYWTLPCFLS